jgi:hypothetical protein
LIKRFVGIDKTKKQNRFFFLKKAMISGATLGTGLVGEVVSVRQLRGPPTALAEMSERHPDKRMLTSVFLAMNDLAPGTARLTNGMQEIDSYYKCYVDGFRNRINYEGMARLLRLNVDVAGWRAVRDVYCEMETRRLVVEVNKASARPYQPPLNGDDTYVVINSASNANNDRTAEVTAAAVTAAISARRNTTSNGLKRPAPDNHSNLPFGDDDDASLSNSTAGVVVPPAKRSNTDAVGWPDEHPAGSAKSTSSVFTNMFRWNASSPSATTTTTTKTQSRTNANNGEHSEDEGLTAV